MKKLSLLFILFLCTKAFSQGNIHPCAASKMNHFSTPHPNLKALADENDYDIKYVKLDVAMSNLNSNISGNVTTNAVVIANTMPRYVFELANAMIVDSILFNGQKLPFTIVGNTREVSLPAALNKGASFQSIIYYHGNGAAPGGGGLGAGITATSSPSWGTQVSYTMSESYSAYLWWPCKQSLHDKIDSSDVYITVPKTCKAGSNGLLQSVTSVNTNQDKYYWKSRHMIDYYLISISVAPYVDYSFKQAISGTNDSILVQNYIYSNPNTLPFFKNNIDATGPMLDYLSKEFGPYPYRDEKYGHCMAPLGGGMEHQTMSTIGSFNSLDVVVHELGHQWFGNNVTCSTWKDIWINEGFASYSEHLYQDQFNGAAAGRTQMNGVHQSVLSSPAGSVYVDDTTNENRIFDSRLSYDKGGAIVHTLRFLMNNDSIFFHTLRQFQQQYQNNVATGIDFKQVAEATSGLNLNDFMNQWYFGEGYPTFSASWNQVGNKVAVVISQTSSAPSITPLFKTDVELLLHTAQGDTTVRVYVDEVSDTIYFNCSRQINLTNSITFDPNQWILNNSGNIAYNSDLNVDAPFATNSNSIRPTIGYNLYPNPAFDRIQIQLPTNDCLIQSTIYNSNGQWISNNTTNVINIHSLPSGAYYLKTKTDKGVFTKSFIKQ
jgi:aminopeptidase N